MNKKKASFINRKYFVLLVVCLITGFIIGFSYNLAKEKGQKESITNYINPQQENYREDLIAQQELNKQTSEELDALERKIREYEKLYSTEEEASEKLVREAQKLRLSLGMLAAEGEGVKVTLEDGDYDPTLTNANDYIVHERHVFAMLNELKISGAEAIAINGQRLKTNSYIVCNGPVITIDGKQHPAPFVIEAVGNKKVLQAALNLSGGVVDQLVSDQIVVTVEQVDHLEMPTVNVES